MTFAMVFPGQGSQALGMQADLARDYSVVSDTYCEASDILGFDIWALVQEGPAEKLGATVVTQPTMLTAGVAAWRVWNEAGGVAPMQLAGHSLGEYSALVCAGAVSFSDALRVVERRAQLMQEAVPVGRGSMAAILGLDDETIVGVCARAADDGIVEPVNFNAPGQVVIAGDSGAVERAIELAKAEGAKRALPLPVSVPAHSSLLEDAGALLAETLAATAFTAPEIPVIAASDAKPYIDGNDIRTRLARQVHTPVLWAATVRALIAAGTRAIIECGPGKVLAGLMRRIDRGVRVAAIDGSDGLARSLEAVETAAQEKQGETS